MKAVVQKAAPFFKGKAWSSKAKDFKDVTLETYKGKNLLLMFYPLDFTFVCPTEIKALSDRVKQFEERDCSVLCCSVDSHFSHRAWASFPADQGGFDGKLELDLLSDLTKNISRDYGVLNEEAGLALRGTFLIDKDSILRHLSINDLGVGRNMDEYLRLVDAFNFTAKYGEVCPASWKKKGDATMDASHTSSKTQEFWKKDFKTK
jgi:peroxiredoxin (alkyl hydroperoxide reductase subunit C)